MPTPNAAPLPSAMPRKANQIHQLILGALVATRPATRSHKTVDPKTNEVVQTSVSTGPALTSPLAQNVSDLSLNAMARRWAA